jgi:hypothetical protein
MSWALNETFKTGEKVRQATQASARRKASFRIYRLRQGDE